MKKLSFNVTSPNDYNHFLRNFVTRMRRELAADNVYQVPRLPPQVDVQVETPEFMDLILHAGTDQVTLRLRTDNLYVVGFYNDRSSRWFEFDSSHRQMIQGSTRLRYQGRYGALGGLPEDIAILGRLASENAIHALASYDGSENNDDQQYRRALRTLIVNFIESIRFHPIANRVARLMHPIFDVSPNQQLTHEDVVNIRNWGHASGFLMMSVTAESIPSSWQTASIPESWLQALQNVNGTFRVLGIEDPTAASSLLGMALFSMTSSSQCSGQRPRRSVEMEDVADESGVSMGGIVLVEVVGVKVLAINDYDPGKLYGTISITDGFGTCQLYNRDKDKPQSVGPGGWADLVWPTRAISGADDFVITLDLKDHYMFFMADREVEHGMVLWNSHDTVPSDFNKIKKVQVKGEYGSVEVHYAVLTDAVIANVKIVVGDDGESTLDVYGDVTATITMASGEPLPYKLFNKDRGNEVKVPKGNDIPLQKKVITVPLCSKLILQAKLQDSKFFSPDKQIAHGSVSFTPRYIGTDSKEITGASGNVRVQVTWSI